MTDDFVQKLGLPFLAHRLRRMSDLIVEGTTRALRSRGFEGPARSVSTLLLLRDQGPMGITEIGFRLRLSHPMIIKLAKALAAAGLVRDRVDPADQRRRLIALTEKGVAQAALADGLLQDIAQMFESLFAETGIDLLEAVQKFEAAADRCSITERLEPETISIGTTDGRLV